MFDKMVKMRNKKAFTLVEMLVVIAIIAILVAIVVPIVGKSTTKARAATNAANLRAVEGQLSTVRVSNPDLFLDAVEKLGQPWDTVVGNLNNLDSILSNSKLYQYLKNELGVDTTKELLDYKLCHFTADENGTIVITGKDSNYTLTDVPASVAVSAGGTVGMEVPEGTPMTIWITNNNVVATYETVSGAYVDANFAEVAETGEFNSRPSGGKTEAELTCAAKGHKAESFLGVLGDSYIVECVCTNCGATVHQATGDTHLCDCGKTLIKGREEHEASVANIIKSLLDDEVVKCKYDDCAATASLITCGSDLPKVGTYSETNGVCNECGQTKDKHESVKIPFTSYYYYYYYSWPASVPTPST